MCTKGLEVRCYGDVYKFLVAVVYYNLSNRPLIDGGRLAFESNNKSNWLGQISDLEISVVA